MNVLTDYKDLVGKTIAFSHMAQFADQITLGTTDGCVLMAAMDMSFADEEHVEIKVFNARRVKMTLHEESNRWMRNELAKLGIFDLAQYEEEQRVKREQEQEEYRKRQAIKEREEYERLKAKFEKGEK